MTVPVEAAKPVGKADEVEKTEKTEELQTVQPSDHEAQMFQSLMGTQQAEAHMMQHVSNTQMGIITKDIQAVQSELDRGDD